MLHNLLTFVLVCADFVDDTDIDPSQHLYIPGYHTMIGGLVMRLLIDRNSIPVE